ncbi:MAG TPA: long-chain-fatty-acid--CoA ligase [Candidatus Eisenbacteria bacterium]
MLTLADIARKGARIHADREAIVFEGTRLTYRELDRRVNRVANALLRLGLAKGERLAVLADNTHKYLEVYLAAAKAGLVTVPINARLAPEEMRHILDDSEAALVLAGDGYEELASKLRATAKTVRTWVGLDREFAGLEYEALLRQAPDVDPAAPVGENDLTILMYTGGTTGTPKGAMLSHRGLLSGMVATTQQMGFTARDVTCMCLPLFHISFWPAFCHLMVGGKVVVVRRPTIAGVLKPIQDERCTHVNAVPTLYNWMLEAPEAKQFDVSSLRLMTYAGSPIPEQVLRRCIERFGNIFAQIYGLTEGGGGTALMQEDHVVDGPRSKLLRSAGKELLLTEVRVVDDAGKEVPRGATGEVAIRGANVMMGYWKKPEQTAAALRDGWLHTGDVGTMDEEGYLYLVDRKADMIVTGGENVYPTETENVLYKHPRVQECVVISAPDAKWGERVQAVVVLRPGPAVTEDELIAFCKERLAGYKCPKKIEFWDALPKSAVGKLLRRDVKAKFWEGRDRRIG